MARSPFAKGATAPFHPGRDQIMDVIIGLILASLVPTPDVVKVVQRRGQGAARSTPPA
jgi:hypothetical protein